MNFELIFSIFQTTVYGLKFEICEVSRQEYFIQGNFEFTHFQWQAFNFQTYNVLKVCDITTISSNSSVKSLHISENCICECAPCVEKSHELWDFQFSMTNGIAERELKILMLFITLCLQYRREIDESSVATMIKENQMTLTFLFKQISLNLWNSHIGMWLSDMKRRISTPWDFERNICTINKYV